MISQPTRKHTINPRQPRPPKPQRKSSDSWSAWVLLGGILVAGVTLPLLIGGLMAIYYFAGQSIPEGVMIANVPVGGQSVKAASETLEQNPPNSVLKVRDGSREWTVLLTDLGIGVDVESSVEAAKNASKGEVVQPRYHVDLGQTQNGLILLSDMVNVAAVPGDTPQNGRSLEIPVLLERIRVDVTGELADGVVDLPMLEIEPPKEEEKNYSPTETTVHVVERGQELGLIAQMYGVSMDDIVAMNNLADPNLIDIGQELVIPAAGLYEPTAADAPIPPTNVGKAIVVSTDEQRIYAYEDGVMIRSHLTSTGRYETPTVLGDYKIYVKYVATDMRGADYFLPDVPYTMYFYQGYGIHGTYWHNSFGRRMSHGCVNLPPDEAQWFFNWAEVGTPVRVI